MSLLSYIVWDADPTMITLFGRSIVWYGLLFAMAFLISQQIMFYIYKKENLSAQYVEVLTIYLMLATIIGARLGHVLFYEPADYLSNPIDILKIWEGGLASHGAAISIPFSLWLYANYEIKIGLKSAFPFIKYSKTKKKRERQSFLWLLDRIVIVVAISGCLIRTGNFINSEIEGLPTNSNSGVIFAHAVEKYITEYFTSVETIEAGQPDITLPPGNDGYYPLQYTITFKRSAGTDTTKLANGVRTALTKNLVSKYANNQYRYPYILKHVDPTKGSFTIKASLKNNQATLKVYTYGTVRHPAQLYEAASCLLIGIILFLIWRRKKSTMVEGSMFGWFLIMLFGLRIIYEQLKENQVPFEDTIPLNMGAWLSVPLVLLGILILILAQKRHNKLKAAG